MSTYRVYWPCCDGVTETEAYEPEHCPFCHQTPIEKPAPDLLEALKAMVHAWEFGDPYTDVRNEIGNARAAIAKATGEQA
jgi:hypothetical protein